MGFRKPLKKKKTQMDEFNEFLINLANSNGVGFRRKILILKKFIDATKRTLLTEKLKKDND